MVLIYLFLSFCNQDAVKKANGREVCGSSIIVEWAKGRPRQTVVRKDYRTLCLIVENLYRQSCQNFKVM